MNTQLADILQLSIPERIQLVEDIWDSVAASPEEVAITEAQKEELERRLASYAQQPDEGIAWSELRDRIRKSK